MRILHLTQIALVCLFMIVCGRGKTVSDPFVDCTTCTNSALASHAIVWPGMTPEVKDQIALAASSSHSGMIRVDLGWVALQPNPPPAEYEWSLVDETIRAIKNHHLDILAVVTELPQWASSNPTDPSFRFYPPRPDAWDDWQSFITAFVTRYGSKGTNDIRHWEIWGEANLPNQWKGTPAEFARLYALAYDAIKMADPTATVLMAGMTEHYQPDWADAVLNDGQYPAKSRIDVIDVHVRGSVDRVQQLVTGWKQFFSSQGLHNKPLWITEFGFPSSPQYQPDWDPNFVGIDEADGQQKQSEYYEAVIPWLMTTGEVKRLFVTLRDLDIPDSGFASEGIVDSEALRAKLAFDTIIQFSDQYQHTDSGG